jgi:lipopolysaccharide/colanic/teichoic acid biosynthesis glycosyltransferase
MSSTVSENMAESDLNQKLLTDYFDTWTLSNRLSTQSLYLKVKRLLDICLSVVALPAVLSVIGLAALAILLFMGRPVFFFQDRVGLNGRVFRMAKLRTMICGAANESTNKTATFEEDPRITRLGRYLRRSHIDELPHLWNVLIGEMSLIGPRPEQPELVRHYSYAIPNYDLRHLVRPGLSGYAQVYYGYAANLNETREKLIYDLFYLQNLGIHLDLVIFLRTLLIFLDRRFVR